MSFIPTEWIDSASRMSLRGLLFYAVTSLLTASAQGAVLRLNPTDDAGNVITFDGPLEATVVQSAAGMDISIKGVKLILECQGNPTDSCKVSVESTGSTDNVSPSTVDNSGVNDNGVGQDPSADDDSDANDDTDCSGLSGFGSQYAGACGDDNVADGSQTPTEPAEDDTSDDPNSGYDLAGSSDSDGDSDSGGWGLKPSTGSGEAPTRSEFPASDRVDYSSRPDVGSGGAQAGGLTHLVPLGLKTVTVMPFTMSSTPVSGGVGYFQPSSTPTGSDFAMWVSTSQDGDPISGCQVYGGFDGKLRISSKTGATGCVLQAGATYYLNAAACVRGDNSDYQCRRKAQTGYEGGNVLLSGDW